MSQEIILIIALIVVAGVAAYIVLGALADAGSSVARSIHDAMNSVMGAGTANPNAPAIVAGGAGLATLFVSPVIGVALLGYAAYKYATSSSDPNSIYGGGYSTGGGATGSW